MKQLRIEKGMAQQKLANTLGVHQTTVKDWETGRHKPSYEILVQLARIFSVTTDYLLGLEDE